MTATDSRSAVESGAPSPAVAPPPGSPRFALFDSLRGIAVLLIVGYHVSAVTGFINHGRVGDAIIVLGNEALVLFFVISGFLLYRPYVSARAKGRPQPSTRRYARRRVLRIVPAYWVALTVLAIFPGIVGVFSGDWWRYYGFMQVYSHRTLPTGIPPAWSLSVEVAFYVLLPLWAMAIRRVRIGSGENAWLRGELGALALLACLGVAIQVLAARKLISDLIAQSLLGACVWLALGMCLAVASVAVERGRGRSRLVRAVTEHPSLCWLGAAASLVGLVALLHPGGLFGLILATRTKQEYATTLGSIALTAALATLLILPAVFGEGAGGLPRRLLAWAPIAWIGLVSYGIYLWHFPVAHVLGLTADPFHFSATGLGLGGKIHHATTPILFVLTLALTAAIAAVSYYVVELPFLRRKER
ncbi:MAG: acyltransferase family protein [Thermoleophilaceae bacterium]